MKSLKKHLKINPKKPKLNHFLNFRARRGTAEIELLLVILFVFLPILLLTGAAFRLGAARLSNVFSAENQAYTQVTAGQNITTSGNITPLQGLAAVQPGLPTRIDYAAPQFTTNFAQGLGITAVTHTDRAAFLDPTWRYGTRPAFADTPPTQQWFEDYVGQSHPSYLVTSLGLAPSYPP